MKTRVALCPIIFLSLQFAISAAAPANNLGWQPAKTWVFAVGALSWKQNGGPAFACVTASAASESSTEHCTFTEALLDSLRGAAYVDLNLDGAITLQEFAAHVEADMSQAEEQLSTFATTKGFDEGMIL